MNIHIVISSHQDIIYNIFRYVQILVFFISLVVCLNYSLKAQTNSVVQSDVVPKLRLELIEEHSHKGEGYNPYLIGSKWQVAHLNFLPELAPDAILKLDVHRKTDETFLLMAGQAVLITFQGGLTHFLTCVLTTQEYIWWCIVKVFKSNISNWFI